MQASSLPMVQKAKEYKIESEGKIFSIKIILSSNIIIEIYELEKIQYLLYIKGFSLEDLIKTNKIFKVCETINEAYNIFEEILEANISSIKLKEDNSLILIINILLPGGKTENVEISLNKREISKYNQIGELIQKVKNLEEKNKNLEEKNKKLEEEINEIKEWKNKIQKLFKDEIEEKEFGIQSKLIENTTDLNFLKNRLINNDPNLNQKNINFKLLYRATRDGDNFNDFHSRVDNKKSTLSIIKTTLGLKFGVFLDIPIRQLGNSIKDAKSFIFSLDLKKIYNSNKSGLYNLNGINSYSGKLLDLNYQPISIYINCLSNNKSHTVSSANANNSYSSFERDYELNNNQQYFTVAEMETFQINFN